MQNLFSLDLALFGGFIILTLGVISFRRFHHFETVIRPEDIGPTAWGLYSGHEDDNARVASPILRRRPGK